MTLASWFLLQQHAAKLDSAALLLFLKRERIGKERRAGFYRLYAQVGAEGFVTDAGKRGLDRGWWERNAVQARKDFHELFAMRPETKARKSA